MHEARDPPAFFPGSAGSDDVFERNADLAVDAIRHMIDITPVPHIPDAVRPVPPPPLFPLPGGGMYKP